MTDHHADPAFAALGEWLDRAWEQTPEVCRIAVAGASIACRCWGGDDPAKPGLVLVHGYRASAQWWDHVAPSFARDYRVAAFDFSGMGDSDERETYSYAAHASELLGVIAALGFDRPVVVAHSFGTVVSLFAARVAPEVISRLILVDGYPSLTGIVPERPQHFYPDREALLARYRLIPPGRWPDPRVMAYLAQCSGREMAQGWTWKFDARSASWINAEEKPADLGHVAVPVDFVYGEFTEIIPAERIARIRDWLPTCRATVMIPMSHHHIMIEQPLSLIAALAVLLAGTA